MKKTLSLLGFFAFSIPLFSQATIPDVYDAIYYDRDCKLYHKFEGKKYFETDNTPTLSLDRMKGDPIATNKGLKFDFKDEGLNGTLYYGLINYNDSKHPIPVWFKKTAKIDSGKAKINILKRLSGKYDMTDWETKGKGTLAYRIANNKGEFMYEGIIGFLYSENTGFSIATTIVEGPFVNILKPREVTLSLDLNRSQQVTILVGDKAFTSTAKKHHEIVLSGLEPDTRYDYTVDFIDAKQSYSFKTAPLPGSRKPFVFAYASDSRAGQGGGERDMYGANFYVMRKISALAKFQEVAFMQFTGDMVNGYSINKEDINLQYANWKRSIEPYAHYFPVVAAMGNHEVLGHAFKNGKGRWLAFVPNFPFETASPSAVFASNFVNPHSDLISEDGAVYDPNPDKMDFPPYDETVFYYTYDNVAVIVLNSNYFYTPTIQKNSKTGGNLHGYLMDNQLKWLEKTLETLENDTAIDHIFISHHTPIFPNGGHVKDDMYYNGDNSVRPTIAGKPVDKGILERRDEYLDLIVNKSTKVVATMTGDEHNYNKVKITPDINIYPEDYSLPKLKRNRTLWQINNGSAGAPYYAQDRSTPWTEAVSGFTTQMALVLVYVEGKKVNVKVMNPDTLEIIDTYILRD